MRQQTTTVITYGILAFAGAVPMTMPRQLAPSSASASAPMPVLSASVEQPQAPSACHVAEHCVLQLKHTDDLNTAATRSQSQTDSTE